MKRVMPLLCFTLLTLVLMSCEHRILEDPYNGHYVRVYIDEHIKNVTYGFYSDQRKRPEYERPRVLRAVLADPITNKVVSERYLQTYGEDERGYYIDGYMAVEAGQYNLMVYNFGTPRTKLRNENDYTAIESYTSPIDDRLFQYFPTMEGELDKKKVRYCPDHLFLTTCERVTVPKSLNIDTLRTHDGDFFTANSVVKSYYLQVRIKGFEHVVSAVSLLSGMAGAKTLYNREMVASDPVSVFFDLDYTDVGRTNVTPKGTTTKTAVLYTTFNTFGKLPEEQSLFHLNFEFKRTDGSTQVESIDITSMFEEPLVVNEQWILIEKEIEIEAPIGGGGGMTPGVDEWADIWADIQL